MRARPLKLAIFASGVVGCMALVSYLAIMKLSLQLVSHRFELPEPPLPAGWAATAAASQRAHGARLVNGVLGCRGCHGADLAGRALLSDPDNVVAHSANLGLFAAHARGDHPASQEGVDAAWVRALRYGLRDDGRALWLMPQTALGQLDDAELAAVIAHLRGLPGGGAPPPTHRLGAVGRIKVAFQRLTVLDLAPIRDNTPLAAPGHAPPRAASRAYGEHLVAIGRCASCHGQAAPTSRVGALPLPAGPPWRAAALRQAGRAAFARALAEGRRLDGAPLATGSVGHDYASLDGLEVGALWAALSD